MFSKRIFLSLITTAVMATMVSAQSNDRPAGWAAKMAGKGQSTTTKSIQATVTSASSASSEDAEDEHDRDKGEFGGTYRAIETFSDGSTARALFTFGPGKNGGIVVHSDELFFVPFPSCISSQGVWKRTDERRLIATDEAFCFDTSTQPFTFDPFGKLKFQSAI